MLGESSEYTVPILLPAQNDQANEALMLQPYFYRTLNATFTILGMVVRNSGRGCTQYWL